MEITSKKKKNIYIFLLITLLFLSSTYFLKQKICYQQGINTALAINFKVLFEEINKVHDSFQENGIKNFEQNIDQFYLTCYPSVKTINSFENIDNNYKKLSLYEVELVLLTLKKNQYTVTEKNLIINYIASIHEKISNYDIERILYSNDVDHIYNFKSDIENMQKLVNDINNISYIYDKKTSISE